MEPDVGVCDDDCVGACVDADVVLGFFLGVADCVADGVIDFVITDAATYADVATAVDNTVVVLLGSVVEIVVRFFESAARVIGSVSGSVTGVTYSV